MKRLTSIITILSIITTARGEVFFRAYEDIYPATGIVSEVNYEENLVSVKDFSGNIWQFTETDDWAVGDICSMIMDSKKTEEIEDDEILAVRYSYIEQIEQQETEKSEDKLFEEYLEEIHNGDYEE